ncbi:MAG: 3-oxoacyl-ACP synthase [Chlorobi bacterium]|nr:3-oxoacyl-ACP synthase [Chlorobiota bacterium]
MTQKERLYLQCETFIGNRLKILQNAINEIQKALLFETKSTAGDKHETGRAMLQLEREKLGQQLAEIQKTKELLSRVDSQKESNTICLGSIVYTTRLNYFISISAGELIDNNVKFYAISPNTPIAKLLLSKRKGDVIEFREEKSVIISTV